MSATASTGTAHRLPTAAQSERRQRIARTLTYSFLIAVAIVYIFPFVIAVVTAFKTEPNATADPLSLIPSPATTTAFHQLYKDQDFLLWIKNSMIVTLERHVPARLPRQPRRVRARQAALQRTRPRVRGDRRRDGRARCRAADPEVPDDPAARDVRPLLGDDHPAARRCRRRLHHEELLRVDPRRASRNPPASTARASSGSTGRSCCRWPGRR